MFQIQPIHAFDDNYIWLLTDGPDTAVVVDPGDADPVVQTLQAQGRVLSSVLITHHHGDHTGGVEELAVRYPGLRVYGPSDRRIPGVTDPVGEGARIRPVGLGCVFQVLEVPGHTSTHIAYLLEDQGEARTGEPLGGALFCGDTLFAGGCGRVFDGTFEQLSDALDRIGALPGETLVYCAHEYTVANLGFAAWVEPDSARLAVRLAAEQARRARDLSTVPSRLDLELATNPFLRTRVPGVVAAAEAFAGRPLTPGREVFKTLRQWKDQRYD